MKVAEIMQQDVDFVSTDTLVKDVAHLIFGRNINGLPVCRGKKVVGFITERDILAQFFPSMQEYMEDTVHARDFEGMEKKIDEILSLPAEEIMSRNPILVTADTPVLKAQSLMFTKKVGRLPVTDKHGNLIGIITKGNIFKSLVGERLSIGEEEKFYDWFARHYDIFIDWKKRLDSEIPDLIKLLRHEKAYKILDVASGTGEHSIALAKNGFVVCGLERSDLMNKISQEKRQKLPTYIAGKITFLDGDYRKAIKKQIEEYNAAIVMGNALPHLLCTDKQILHRIEKLLHLKNSLMFIQITNFHKHLHLHGGFRRFVLRKTHLAYEKAHLFVTFFHQIDKNLMYNLAIFDYVGKRWIFRGVNSTPIKYIGQKEITQLLKQIGFKDITFYGGMTNGPLFSEPYDEQKHDYLNVVARR